MPHGMNTGNGKRSSYTPINIDFGITEQPTIGQTRGAQQQSRPEPTATKGSRYKYTPLNINLGITSQPTKAQSSSARTRPVVPKAEVPSVATKTETPTANPERPGQPSGGEEVSALGGGTYNVMGVEYDSASGQAINPDTGKTSSGGYSIDPKTSQRTDYSRGETRTNANGMVQTGTSTSPRSMTFDDANSVLAKYGISNNGFGEKFSSNQLPGTKGSPYGQSSSADNQVMGGSARDSAVIEGGGSVETVIGGDTDLDSVKSTYSGGDKSARRRAFLDYSGPGGAMGAMRAAEAADGVMYAGGKHHIANPNAGEEGQNDFMAINKDEARQIQFGKQSAQGLRDQYVNKLTGNESAQEIGEASQNAPAMLPDAVPGNTPMDKSPFDTEELMQQRPGKSIIGNNTPYTSAKPGTLY